MKFQQRLIIGDRPSHVPATADIFNAPRPLFGSLENEMPLTWQGDFATGRHYAAVTQEDDLRSNWLEQNRRLAATRLVYITEEQAKDMVRPELFGRYPSLTEDLFCEVWKNMFEVTEVYAGDFVVHTAIAYEQHRNAALLALAALNGSDCRLDRNGFVVNGNYTHVQNIRR